MLGKLIKYEFKATALKFIYLYIGVIILSLITKFAIIPNKNFNLQATDSSFYVSSNDFVTVIFSLTFIVLITLSIVFTLTSVHQRFKEHILSDEGYLTFTLPVSVDQLLISKIIVNTIWFIATIFTIILSLIILSFDIITNESFIRLLQLFLYNLSNSPYYSTIITEAIIMIVLGFIDVLVAFISFNIICYTCHSIAHYFNKHKSLIFVVSFFGIYIIISIVNNFINSLLLNNANIAMNIGENEYSFNTIGFVNVLKYSSIVSIILYSVISVGLYFFVRYTFSKKLNLE